MQPKEQTCSKTAVHDLLRTSNESLQFWTKRDTDGIFKHFIYVSRSVCRFKFTVSDLKFCDLSNSQNQNILKRDRSIGKPL